ncbi:MAG: coproporphyrinogen III oxidase family protein [Myxococcales bacterium FL481]|nr:MAG: coproporphyrinogen III oxidase family protein [Myxococcales bacterium FL481]
MSSSSADTKLVGLYVHVPFCARACPYCDFHFRVEARPAVRPLLAALEAELHARGEVWQARRFDTVYIGGGTPSALGPAGLHALVAWCKHSVDLAATAEISVELNPEHVDPAMAGELASAEGGVAVVGGPDAMAGELASAGVDRVTLGVQSFSEVGLRTLGRAHRSAAASRAIDQLLRSGIQVGVDLIVGWPRQRDDELDLDVRTVVASGVSHVSVYALTLDEGVAWHKLVRRGARSYPDADRQADLLLRAESQLVQSGFEHYELSNYARGRARSRHNEKYWTGQDYLGLGPSAASARHDARGGVWRETNPQGVAAWLADAASRPPTAEHVTGEAAAAEALWLGLRRLEGVALPGFLARHPGLEADWVRRRLARQAARGNVRWEPAFERVSLAAGRWQWHDEVGLDLVS